MYLTYRRYLTYHRYLTYAVSHFLLDNNPPSRKLCSTPDGGYQ